MTDMLPPFSIFIVGALLIPFLPPKLKKSYLVFLPTFGLINLLTLAEGTHFIVNFQEYTLVLGEIDRLSRIFGIIFHIISIIGSIYILNCNNNIEYVAGMMYAGCALGVVFAGDLISLFFFWEGLAVCSMFLILARKTKAAVQATYRYALVHAVGGLFLLAGIILYSGETGGSFTFGKIGLGSIGSYLIFIGFGINCAWPLFHSWLVDAYPEATIGGAVFLSAFTTKTSVYVLARAFPGEPFLILIGATMAAFPIFFAVIENDLRRVLAYSLINQMGFMVVGIGIGTEMAINGAAAHAFAHILYKGLLFMSMGAVLYRTGKINATDLGGLYKSMPYTCIFCIIGAASISAFPLFSGFVSKSLVMSAAVHEHLWITWFILLFAAAGVFHHAGIKIPFFSFFGHDAGIRVKEAPLNMLIAMGMASFLCIFIGAFPGFLYELLPYQVDYIPYTYDHVIGQLQLLLFSAMAFTLLFLSGVYPAEIRAINLDVDWIYRKGGPMVYFWLDLGLNSLNKFVNQMVVEKFTGAMTKFFSNGPANITMAIFEPICRIFDTSCRPLDEKKQKVHRAFSLGSFSIASTAIFSALFLFILLML